MIRLIVLILSVLVLLGCAEEVVVTVVTTHTATPIRTATLTPTMTPTHTPTPRFIQTPVPTRTATPIRTAILTPTMTPMSTSIPVLPSGSPTISLTWSDFGRDRVGMGSNPNPDGRGDGHFKLRLDVPSDMTVSVITLYSTDANGRKPTFGGHVWDTDPGYRWMLGVYRGDKRLNPQDTRLDDQVVGQITYDIYANDTGSFQENQHFGVTVRFADNTEVMSTVGVVSAWIPIPRETPIVEEEGIPIPISTPKGFVVIKPIEIEVKGTFGCDEPQLPGDKCNLESFFVSSRAKIDQQPCIDLKVGFTQGGRLPKVELTTTSKTFNKQDGTFTLAAEGSQRGQDKVLFGAKVSIPNDAKSGIYRLIEVVVKLPNSSGRCIEGIEVARIKLAEQIQVKPGLELVVEKVVPCGYVAVGGKCTLFFSEVVKVSDLSTSQSGRLDVLLKNLEDREISKPDGFELFQRVDGGDEEPLGTVTVKQWKESAKVEIILKVTGGVKMIELGIPELVLLEL